MVPGDVVGEAREMDGNTRSGLEKDDESYNEESKQDEDSVATDDMMPLVPAPPRRRKRMASFAIASREDEEETSCWGQSWRFLASMFLTTLFVAPLIHSHMHRYNNSSPGNQASEDVTKVKLSFRECSKQLHFDYKSVVDAFNDPNFSNCPPKVKKCRCYSTMRAQSKGVQSWYAAHERNSELARNGTNADVVFIGDSITEHWMGTDFGVKRKKNAEVQEVFTNMFSGTNAEYQGVALGISGDVCPGLLFRLENGELPDTLDPSVIWLLMGANDLSLQCSVNAVLTGISTLVEYLVRSRPKATIVVNSLLPALLSNKSITLQESALFQSSESVNSRLACYVESLQSKQVQFFNATGLFIKDNRVVGMQEYVHPSGEGASVWLNAIVKRLHSILDS